MLNSLEKLQEMKTRGNPEISGMDEILFADMVENFNAHDTHTVDFTLINGLVLTERLFGCEQ